MRIDSSNLISIRSELKELLKNLEVGDTLKGRVLEALGRSVVIRAASGQAFTALLQEGEALQEGASVELIIRSITDGKVFAELKGESKASDPDNKISEFLRQVNLPMDEKNMEAAKLLIKYKLPLSKETIMNITGLKKSIENLNQSSEGRVGLLISGLNIKETPVDVLNKIVITWSGDLAEQNASGDNVLNKLVLDSGGEIKRFAGQVSDILASIRNADMEAITYLVSKEMDITPKNLCMLIRNIENRDEISQFLDMFQQKMTVEVKESIRKIFLEPRQLEDGNEAVEQLKDMAKLGEKLETFLSDNKDYDPEIRDALSNFRDSIDFIREINQHSNFMQLPVIINGDTSTAKLYVFKEGKRGKKINPEDATIVVALDLNSLGHLESMIRVKGKAVNIIFRVENKSIGTIIEKNGHLLSKSLRKKGYNISYIRVISLEKPFSLLSLENMINEIGTEKIHFDMRV